MKHKTCDLILLAAVFMLTFMVVMGLDIWPKLLYLLKF